MELKLGVSVRGLQPQMALAALVAEGIYVRLGHPCVITSGSDGKHMDTSLHYKGLALDFRLPGMPPTNFLCVQLLKTALGAEYDVVLEDDHVHVEHDPKEVKP